MTTLHLITQRGQPLGGVRTCCEMCGLMLIGRDEPFWREHSWTSKPDNYVRWPAAEEGIPAQLVPCTEGGAA